MANIIPLTNSKHTIVDDDDFLKFSKYNWYFHKSDGYAVRKSKRFFGKQKMLYLHREIMGNMGEKQIDHIDGDKLNNQKKNLRFSTNSQNHANIGLISSNKSGFKGVSWNKNKKRWSATIFFEGKAKHL